MTELIAKMGKWIGLAFSDDGTPSSTRILTAVIVAFVCGWVTAIVRHSYTLPDFAGVSLFIGTLYGLHRAAGVGEKYLDGRNNGNGNGAH